MTASFPTTVKSFTAVTDGVDYPEAVDINSLQEEVAAIETLIGSAASNIYMTNQSTASVSTSATTILTASAFSQIWAVVSGNNGASWFVDTIVSADGVNPTALTSTTTSGTPAARTYTGTGSGVFKLAMASGTYTIRVAAFVLKY